MMKSDEKLEIKGLLGTIAAAFSVISYMVYYCYYFESGIKLNELFFISTGLSISIFSGLLFTFFKNKISKTLTLFCSIFYLNLVIIYVFMGLIYNQYTTHIKLSLFIGLIAGLIYFIYDSSNNRRTNGV